MNNSNNVIKLIGYTPLVKLDIGLKMVRLLVKLETYNLTGSIKDRLALYLVKKAIQNGRLKKNSIIIEATTGNTGISLAALAGIYGLPMIAVMPADVTRERIAMIKAYGASVVLTPDYLGPRGAIDKRDELIKKVKNSWTSDQFNNPGNIRAHQLGIGGELLSQIKGRVDYFVHGIGTGGTFVGVIKALKKKYPNLVSVAVEPAESAVPSGKKPGSHGISGIGEGFIPSIIDLNYIDQIITVPTNKALEETKKLARRQGLLAGFSSGANITAIKKLAKKLTKPATILTIFADRGERYLSIHDQLLV